MGTRFLNGYITGVNQLMARWMEQNSVFISVRTAVHSLLNVVVMPPSLRSDFLLADWTDSVLFSPKTYELAAPFEGFCHFALQPFLKVHLPGRIEGIGSRSGGDVPFNRQLTYVEKLTFFPLMLSEENPVVKSYPFEVPSFTPSSPFVAVSPQSPS